MLFRKDLEPSCMYCQRGRQISDLEIACVKCGVVPAEHHCRAFRYDPLKRIPPRPVTLDTGRFTEADFSL